MLTQLDQPENPPGRSCEQSQLSNDKCDDILMTDLSTGRQSQSTAGAEVVFRQLGRLSPRHTSVTGPGNIENRVTGPEVGREVSAELDIVSKRESRNGKSVRESELAVTLAASGTGEQEVEVADMLDS